ncbi:RNA-directed DNA polymerase, eukaryota [Tanacetum coccineum]
MGCQSRKGELLSDDVNRRDKMLMELLEIKQAERNSLRQKSRIKWAHEGDENTKFFHTLLNKKSQKQNIRGLIWNEVWSNEPEVIKSAAFNHFIDRFKEPNNHMPKFHSSLFQKLDRCEINFLEDPINMEEIKLAVWSCSSSKSLGPNGLNFKLIKRYWELFKDNFFKCVNHFENIGMLTKGCNASFIVLIPKNLDPPEMGDYRPISLIGCVYKVISKVLSSRLAKFAKKEGIELLLIKVDFEKAFNDSVSVLVNGSPTDEFQMERGIRQGDPLSSFLFLLVAEALQVLILEACNKGVFTGLFLDNDGSNVSFLQYADDALFFREWSYSNASNLIRILGYFQDTSRLCINLSKSRLYGIWVDPAQVKIIANAINCVHEKLPFVYLGLPVGSNMRKGQSWNGVTE